MNLSIGIIGLPNVGKSTLFNALLKKQQAFVANYPFATIEPNIGIVPVPDERLNKLAEIEKSEKIIPAVVKFVDIAGLVKGAAVGEGLGNKFLSHVRECNAICQVVRHFSNKEVIHVSETPNPKSDYETVNTELILADLQTIEKSSHFAKASRDNEIKNQAIKKLSEGLNKGTMANNVQLTNEESEAVRELQLLTMKPMFIVANVDEGDLNKEFPDNTLAVSAKVESELSELSENEQKEYLKTLGLKESGLERIIKKGYEVLNLISFLTAGEKEARAWTLRAGSTALSASGVIHTDFMKNFIKAEVISYGDFISSNGPASPDSGASRGGWKNARELGKTRFEGRDYIVKDGDVVEFKIGV